MKMFLGFLVILLAMFSTGYIRSTEQQKTDLRDQVSRQTVIIHQYQENDSLRAVRDSLLKQTQR